MDESVSMLAVRLLSEVEAARGLLVVVDGEQKAESLARLLSQLDPHRPTFHFPAWDCLPYDRAAPSADLMGHRMRVLADLSTHPNALLITTPEAAIQRVPPRAALPNPTVLKIGAALDGAAFGTALAKLGYTHADRVDDPGHVAVRGEVIDIFPATTRPYRIGLADGRITSIHRYDPATQRSTGDVAAIRIDAMSEIVTVDAAERFEAMDHWWPDFYAGTETLFDLLPDAKLVVDPQAERRSKQIFAGLAEAYRDRVAADRANGATGHAALSPKRLYVSEAEWTKAVAAAQPYPSLDGAEDVPRFCLMDKPGQAFTDFIDQCFRKGLRVVVSGARERELAILAKQVERAAGATPRRIESWADVTPAGDRSVGLLRLCADHGFIDRATATALITAADLLGHHARALSTRAVPVPWHLGDGDFATGDLVIHLDHGVGLLKGLENLESPEGSRYDAVRLGFAEDADLLVPTDTLDRVWRYGGDVGEVALDRLEGRAWPKRQAKIAKDIEAAAKRLVDVARRRRGCEAMKIVPPRRAYEQFVAGFPFAPTADQMHAIDDCLRDLAGDTPMDRLVVGDVGFGKTEVALRAAAAAVLAGHQVAVVAPTTVLARQHLQSFRRRFEAVGIEVAQLSRLASAADNDAVAAGLALGDIRLVVGTQALCGPEIAFKDLGLLIIDEEQRFGTADKERIRVLGAAAHVLTLTATPIPRTLQSALVGLQDLSIIATPPARRRPIRTLVEPFDAPALRTALRKEKARGGQSFVVVPRIEDLEPLAEQLRSLVPELVLTIAHGQMEPATIEAAMTGFAAGVGDVLLATSIIESGLDVPRANTMVICRADRFGLAELHQLRGRVGRGRLQGVCFLLTEPDHVMAPATERRLATLARLDRLGSGMAISAQDLDARGGGDLVGEEQAGHSHLIGLGLYQHLLQRALQDANGTSSADDWVPELHLGDGGGFSSAYIPEPDVRINLYARVARATDAHELDLLSEEVEDRFGPLTADAAALLSRARLKCLCRSRRVARIDVGPKAVAFTPCRGTSPEALLEGASSRERSASRVKGGRLLFAVAEGMGSEDRLQLSARLLQGMS